MSNTAFWYLENIDLPQILCPKKQVDKGNKPSAMYKKGEYIYIPNDKSDRIFFISEGRVKIGTYSDSGKEITKVMLGKGEVFGELAITGEERRRDFAYAMEDTDVCSVTVNEMKGLFRDHNALQGFFLKLMGSRIIEMENRLESLVFKDSRTRIIEFLVEQGKKKGQTVGTETLVKRFMTHQDIANITATSRQTVTTVLNDLRDNNLISFNRSRLLIRDLSKLEKTK